MSNFWRKHTFWLIFTAALALRSRGLVIGSREEKEKEEKEEEKNLQIAFRCIEAVPILSLDYWYNPGGSPGGVLRG